MLAVVKPSPLRLWGFLLTALGGALIAFGSIADWARVSVGNRTAGAVPTSGIDLWPGKVTVVLGAAIVVSILALRFVSPDRRGAIAALILVLALIAVGLTLYAWIALRSLVRDAGTDALVRQVVDLLGLDPSEARSQVLAALVRLGIGVRAQSGLWLSATGGALAAAGGILDLLWVRQKRIRGDAIDPDTLPQTEVHHRTDPDTKPGA
jgi:hypothetical protein